MSVKLTGRRKEVLMTVVSNLVLQAVTAVCGFVLPPLIVRTFGSEINGMVSSITQFIAYLSLVEAGVGGAAIAALYRPLAEKDTGKCSAILSASAEFYRKSGILFVILVFMLAFFYPLAVDKEVDRMQAGLMVLVLGITSAAEFFLIGKYRVLLTADKKMYVISIVQSAAVILNTAVAVVLIRLGTGIILVKLASSLVFLSRYAAIALYVHRKYADIHFHSAPDVKAISQSRNVMVHQIGGLVVFNSPLVIITLFCSLKDASVYAVYAMVFTAVGNLLGSLSNGLQSFFGESLIKNDIKRTESAFGLYETLFYASTGWAFSCSYILTIPFMSLYTRNMTDADYVRPLLVPLFVAVGAANYARKPCDLLIMAAGHFRQTQFRSVLESAINIVAGIAFTVRFGMCGVLFGGICSYLYRTLDIIIYSNVRILKRNPLRSFAKIGICLALYATMSVFLKHRTVPVNNYAEWILYAIAIGLIYAVPVAAVLGFLKMRRSAV